MPCLTYGYAGWPFGSGSDPTHRKSTSLDARGPQDHHGIPVAIGRQRLAEGAMNRFQQRRIGRTDLQVSVLGLGGAPLGDLYERIPPDWALATLETAYWRGIRLFDTAPLYGHGLSEHRFGHVLRDKPRAEFVISTKVGRWLRPERSEQVDRGQFVGGLNFQTVYDYSYDGKCAHWSRAISGLAWIRSTSRSFTTSISGRMDPPRPMNAGFAKQWTERIAPLMNCDALEWSGPSASGSTRSRPAFASPAKPRSIASCSRADTRSLNRTVSTISCHSQSSKAFRCWLAAHSTRQSWPPVLHRGAKYNYKPAPEAI